MAELGSPPQLSRVVRASTWTCGDVPCTYLADDLRHQEEEKQRAADKEEEDLQDPLWLEQASAILPAALETLDTERTSAIEAKRLREERKQLADRLRAQEEKLAEALEDLEVVQEERDELEGACEEAHAQMEQYEVELDVTLDDAKARASAEAALAKALQEQATLQAQVAKLNGLLAERDAEILRVVNKNAALVQRLADAGLSASL